MSIKKLKEYKTVLELRMDTIWIMLVIEFGSPEFDDIARYGTKIKPRNKQTSQVWVEIYEW